MLLTKSLFFGLPFDVCSLAYVSTFFRKKLSFPAGIYTVALTISLSSSSRTFNKRIPDFRLSKLFIAKSCPLALENSRYVPSLYRIAATCL